MRSLVRGLTVKEAPQGKVYRCHYSADPERDPAINPQWETEQRKLYSSEGAWMREQNIVHEAGGGELLFADILNKWGDQIIVDPAKAKVPPQWKLIGGFDHGKTNPTAALVGRIDFDGNLWLIAEYYQPGMHPKQHCPKLMELNGFMQAETIFADPSIFYETQLQADGSFKAISGMYEENGISNLCPAPDNSELTGMERIEVHWLNIAEREPSLKILCPPDLRDIQKPVYGICNDGCPNLLWELRRTRKAKLSATQLVNRNPTEKIVDKDNHLRDALKYIVLSLPEPTALTPAMKVAEAIKHIPKEDATSRMIHGGNTQMDAEPRPATLGNRGAFNARRFGGRR